MTQGGLHNWVAVAIFPIDRAQAREAVETGRLDLLGTDGGRLRNALRILTGGLRFKSRIICESCGEGWQSASRRPCSGPPLDFRLLRRPCPEPDCYRTEAHFHQPADRLFPTL